MLAACEGGCDLGAALEAGAETAGKEDTGKEEDDGDEEDTGGSLGVLVAVGVLVDVEDSVLDEAGGVIFDDELNVFELECVADDTFEDNEESVGISVLLFNGGIKPTAVERTTKLAAKPMANFFFGFFLTAEIIRRTIKTRKAKDAIFAINVNINIPPIDII